ncbi:30S ribosomal protein S1 [candidate division KSB1 bacterium]|nr:30S ribosomal protein S1 [candidate division KSB1 bacterium]
MAETKSESKESTENNSEVETVKLEDLVEEQEYSQDEYQKFEQIYESTINKFSDGEIVSGRIISIDSKDVSVDIGFKSEGLVPIDEFSNSKDLNIGDEIEVYIDNIEDKDGQLVLSSKKADFVRAWDKVIEVHEKDEVIKGKVSRRIKGGMVVDLIGVEAFLPGSQIDIKPVRDFDALVNQEFEFKIVNVNHLRRNIVVSRRVLIEEDMKGLREKILMNLDKGQKLEGTVKNITNFGVFIDLGGVDGLLHINDLSWGRIGHPSEVVSLDEKIEIVILDFDEDKSRISLGLKQLTPHPWDNIEDKFTVGTKISGKVVNIADYGAFIELEKGIEGLIHISEMSWIQHIKHPSQVVSMGDEVETIVLSVDKEGQKISLGLKQLEPDPWDKIEEKYPLGTRHNGVVRNLTNFGAFVELEDGVDGLVHISDLSWTRKIRHPSEVIKKNDNIEVEVLAIERENRRISLGYKQLFDNPWDILETQYKVGIQVKGVVTRCIEKGLVTEIPDQVEGFVPISHLTRIDSSGRRRTADAYKIDDELELTVIEFDKNNKRIVLSEKSLEELNLKTEQEAAEKTTEAQVEAAPEVKDDTEVKADIEVKEDVVVKDDIKQDSKPKTAQQKTKEKETETGTPKKTKAKLKKEEAEEKTNSETTGSEEDSKE